MVRKKKCKSGNHRLPLAQIYVKYCPGCGELVNPEANVVNDCSQYHYEKARHGYKYCPDCGEKL